MGYYRAGGFLDWLADLVPKGLPAEPGAAGAQAGRALGGELYGAHWAQDPVLAKAGAGPASWSYVGSDVMGTYNPALEMAVSHGGMPLPLSDPRVIGGPIAWDTTQPVTSLSPSTPHTGWPSRRSRTRRRRRTTRRRGGGRR